MLQMLENQNKVICTQDDVLVHGKNQQEHDTQPGSPSKISRQLALHSINIQIIIEVPGTHTQC